MTVTVDLPTFLGLTDQPGEILDSPGVMLTAEQLRALLPDAQVRRLITDPLTGHLLDYGQSTYRIPAPLAAYLTARHVTSTGPGSTVPASRCDLDHAHPYPHGPTSPDNLQPVNRRWHRAKTLAGWTVTPHGHGRFTWTSPHGMQTTVEPHDYRLGP